MKQYFKISHDDFDMAGEASSTVKRTLTKIGVPPPVIKRVAIAMYEAEINAFIHGGGGEAFVDIDNDRVEIVIRDHGKGIPDLELAMQEGWSTADENVRKMGFGAGMGLPNIRKNTDELDIITAPGEGTEVRMIIYMKENG
ncbi:MAG: ATP-binding protein [Clostridiales bacterium]|nr:ATP-binding protein [Clostridiales bacterium]MDD7035161.1 ATP-binding protein [Bacillota bacterium]MDY2920007.1 ATP-binding protein [Lentihominibacter sp.]